MKKKELRISGQDLDDVCLDCSENIKTGVDCNTCPITKLKEIEKEAK